MTDTLFQRLAEASEEFKEARARGESGRQAVGEALALALTFVEAARPDVADHLGPIYHLLSVLSELDQGREIDPLLQRAPIGRGRPPEPQRHNIFKQFVAAATMILHSEGMTRDAASQIVWRRLHALGWRGGKQSAPKNFLDAMEKLGKNDPATELFHAHLRKWEARGTDPSQATGNAKPWVTEYLLNDDLKEFF